MSTEVEQDSDQAEETNTNAETIDDLMEIQNDKERRDTAWQEYRGYDETYEQANAERAARARIGVEYYPQATFIEQIRVDETTGLAISGHEYNPEAASHRDTEAELQRYLEATPAEDRFVVFEGQPASFTDRATAIRQRADAGLALLLADENNIERVTGEPSDLAIATALEQQGVSRDETALYTTLRHLGANLTAPADYDQDQAGNVYYQLAINGTPGFRNYSEAEKAEIDKAPAKRDQLLRDMADQAAQYALENFNPILRGLDLPQFEIGSDGTLTLSEANGPDLMQLASPSGSGRIGDIGRLVSGYRDRHIFDTVADAVQAGKKPLIVYGGSHIVALKPALDAYFTTTSSP
jgi:hypothetical protein